MPAQGHAQWRAGHNRWKGQTAALCRSARPRMPLGFPPLSRMQACVAGQRMHRRTVDAPSGDQGRGSRQKGRHHEPGHVSAMPGRQGEPDLQSGSAKQAVGSFIVAPLVRAQWTTTSLMCRPGRAFAIGLEPMAPQWLTLRSLRDRCLRTADRWLARVHIHDGQVRPRRIGSGNLAKKNDG